MNSDHLDYHFISLAEEDRILFEQTGKNRITPIIRAGEKVWIKRYDTEKLAFSRWLHDGISPLLPWHFLRAAPVRDSHDLVRQELRKMLAFKSAGLAVPEPICAFDTGLMLADVGETLQERLNVLRPLDTVAHDNLLIQCAETLGKAHSLGLCHGRPNLRDMFVEEREIGFFDFEEEPEAVMPLAQAQARDVWLLFFQITTQSVDREHTPQAAFNSWRRHIFTETLYALRQIIRFFRIFCLPLKLSQPIWLGKDGKHVLNATEFFITRLGLKK